MQRKLILVTQDITVKLDCGTTLTYGTLIPVYSYQLDESEIINCVYPQREMIITPCRVKEEHIYYTRSHIGDTFIGNYTHYLLYGKTKF